MKTIVKVMAGLVLALPLSAAAQDFNGDETVGELRAWSADMRAGYIMGARAAWVALGMRCVAVRSNEEMETLLLYNPSIAGHEKVPVVIGRVLSADGCGLPRTVN